MVVIGRVGRRGSVPVAAFEFALGSGADDLDHVLEQAEPVEDAGWVLL
jgi:hypothetical protein